MKKTAVVVCPGRGTYNRNELGYLHQFHENKFDMIKRIDEYRKRKNQVSIWELDGKKNFSIKEHLPGENSAALIYACSYGDFLDINLNKYEISAVTGNSMGWYSSLVCAGALNLDNGIHLINSMGSQMKDKLIGGQILYPEVNEDWIHSQELTQLLDQKIEETNKIIGHEAYNSISYGGYRVIGANENGLKFLMNELPQREGRYPLHLPANAAFHTPLLTNTSIRAKLELSSDLFQSPKIPLIDGRGKIWMPHSTDPWELWNYTLGHQVDNTYDFSRSIEVAVKEFAPDYLILTGPGTNLGGAVAQILINRRLKPILNKEDFKKQQQENPYILAMGELGQRELTK